jgi:O-phosphoseryl-tRNA(Sec) kinase
MQDQKKSIMQDQKKSIIIMLVGLPASGKSNFATFLIEQFQANNQICSIVDTDKIRESLFGRDFIPENESQVLDQKKFQITKGVKHNQFLIIDDLHYYTSMRHEIHEIATELNVPLLHIYFKTPLNRCLEWNEKRGFYIPNELIEKIDQKFDLPGKKYNWDKPDIIYNPIVDIPIDVFNKILDVIKKKNQIKQTAGIDRLNKMNSVFKSNKSSPNLPDLPSLEIKTRNIIGQIVKSQIGVSDLNIIHSILNQNYSTEGEPYKLTKRIINLKKKFLIWLKDSSILNPSIQHFIEFLNYNFQSKN